MAERRIISLPFGEGLQRSDGVMVVAPTTFADLRNVYQYEGKAQVRRGLLQTSELIDDVGAALDMTLALGPLRAENAAIGIGFDDATKEVWANRLTIAGASPANIGLLGTLGGAATYDPPIIILADSDNKCFIAHDEPNVNARLVTKYYDPFAFPQLVTLQADLDGNGLAPVYFRGVVRHLSYMFGWGYGNATDPDRIDVVRVSTGGDPTIFRDDAFFEVGQRGEPVMVCRPAGQFLMVFKETETYQIFGYSPDTFGIRPADTLFGCVSSRLAVSIAGSVFFWSVQGPRVTTGGESVDLAVPLDLDGPDPSTLAAESDVQDAFAEYDPATRVIHFVWGRRVYALSIRNPSRPRWSYYELGEPAQCGAQFFATQTTAGGGGQPADGPEFDVTTPFDDITATTVLANWANVGATGGEQIEVWAREAGGVVDGALEEPAAGVVRSAYNFEHLDATGQETDLGGDWRVGYSIRGAPSVNWGIADDPVEGKYLFITETGNDGFNYLRFVLFQLIAWDAIDALVASDEIEFLARVYQPATVDPSNAAGSLGPVWAGEEVDGDESANAIDFMRRVGVDPGSPDQIEVANQQVGPNDAGAGNHQSQANITTIRDGWAWVRYQFLRDLGAGEGTFRAKIWTGDIDDEPAGWTLDFPRTNPNVVADVGLGRMGLVAAPMPGGGSNWSGCGCSFIALTTDPTNYPTFTPADFGGGPWQQVGEFTYNGLATQSGTITGLDPNKTYDFALRYRRGGQYNPSAVDSDPATWPAVAQASVTTAESAPVAVLRGDNNGLWQVISGTPRITIGWEIPVGSEGLQIEVERRIRTEGDTTVQDVDGLGIGPPGTSDPAPGAYALVATLAAGSTGYTDTSLTNHRWHDYRVRFVGQSVYSDVISCWAGPDRPTGLQFVTTDPLVKVFTFQWVNANTPTGRSGCPGPLAPPNNHSQVYYYNDFTATPAADDWKLVDGIFQSGPFTTFEGTHVDVPIDNTDIGLAIRHVVTCFGVDHPSPWSQAAFGEVGTGEG